MKSIINLPYAPIFMLSALLAAALAFGDIFASSSVPAASAGSSSKVAPCEGQTWPHYTVDCLASLDRDGPGDREHRGDVKIAY